jgi:hypothetical protein
MSGVRENMLGPTSGASWNKNVSCSATVVMVSAILGSGYPSQSLQGSQYQTYASAGGVPDKRALSPPCSITNVVGQSVSAFVEVDNVTLQNYFYETRDCSAAYQPVNGGAAYGKTICDSTGDVYESVSSSAFVHVEVDQDWMAKGYCGPGSNGCDNNTIAHVPLRCTIPAPCGSSVRVNVQGFVWWDPEGHWEIHPLTAWEPATGSPSGGSNGGSGSGGSNGTCSSCSNPSLFSSYLWLVILGAAGFVGLLGFFTLRTRAKLRQAKRRLGKQDEPPGMNG